MKKGGALRAPFKNKNEGRGAPRRAPQNKAPTGPAPLRAPRSGLFRGFGALPGSIFKGFSGAWLVDKDCVYFVWF